MNAWVEHAGPLPAGLGAVGPHPVHYGGSWWLRQPTAPGQTRVLRYGLGASIDPNLQTAATALLGVDPCASGQPSYGSQAGASQTVAVFQQAYNQTVDPNIKASPSYKTLTVNGEYLADTAAALAQVTGANVPSACVYCADGVHPTGSVCTSVPAPTGGGGGTQPTPAPAPAAAPAPTSLTPWIVGGALVLGIGIVAAAAYARPTATEIARARVGRSRRLRP